MLGNADHCSNTSSMKNDKRLLSFGKYLSAKVVYEDLEKMFLNVFYTFSKLRPVFKCFVQSFKSKGPKKRAERGSL